MSTPLEYLLLMLIGTSQPSAGAVLNDIDTAAGNNRLRKSVIMKESGEMEALTVLSTSANPDGRELEAPISVPREWVKHIAIGTPLKLFLHGTGQIINTRITRLEETTDSRGRHSQGIAAVKNIDGSLMPGMIATASINLTR